MTRIFVIGRCCKRWLSFVFSPHSLQPENQNSTTRCDNDDDDNDDGDDDDDETSTAVVTLPCW